MSYNQTARTRKGNQTTQKEKKGRQENIHLTFKSGEQLSAQTLSQYQQ